MGLLRRTSTDVHRDDRKFLGRSEPPQDLTIVAADGSRVRDARGRTFIDFQMGWSVGNLGWNPPEILARIRRFEGPTYVAPGVQYAPWVELARQLVELAPGKLARVFRAVGGTEAVELALQLAMAHTGRHKIVSIEDAYHGNSIGARTVGADDGEAHLVGFKKLALPLDTRALDRLETLLKHRDIAAFIMEPTITNLGVIIPESDFMHGLVPLCHRYGTLVIMDEVATGLGRTGKMFASEHYGIEPDLMCLAKGLGSGVAPIAATLATAEVAKAELEFYSTGAWMPLAVEAALGTLAYLRDHASALHTNVSAREAQLRRRLRQTFPDAELRIQGLAVAVGLDERRVTRIEKRCREEGLLLYGEEDSLVMFPALTVDEATVDEALQILADAAG